MSSEEMVYTKDGKFYIDSDAYVIDNFTKLKVNVQNWTKLWHDPKTGEYWMQFFEHPELQAGGPPWFVRISEEEAKSAFGNW
jgi:hypothetical protein